jgi:hypothetical protein
MNSLVPMVDLRHGDGPNRNAYGADKADAPHFLERKKLQHAPAPTPRDQAAY